MTQTASPLAALASAEAHLVHAIDEAATVLDGVGRNAVGAALEHLQASADEACRRIAAARCRLNGIVSAVVQVLDDTGNVLLDDMERAAVPEHTEQTLSTLQQTEPTITPAIAEALVNGAELPAEVAAVAVVAGEAIDLTEDLAAIPGGTDACNPAAEDARQDAEGEQPAHPSSATLIAPLSVNGSCNGSVEVQAVAACPPVASLDPDNRLPRQSRHRRRSPRRSHNRRSNVPSHDASNPPPL